MGILTPVLQRFQVSIAFLKSSKVLLFLLLFHCTKPPVLPSTG